ncbi:MAG: hypothetical protein U9N62_11850 [Thermotogota bacterium]|nr:hypothetical protein [Thermotogota bacterium]
MKGWKMYSKIHQLKEDGLKKAQVARKLDINYKSVTKYWTMSPSDYQAYLEKTKSRKKETKGTVLAVVKKHIRRGDSRIAQPRQHQG